MNRPKFLRHYANGMQLRVEQIGPDLWCGAAYRGAIPAEILNKPEPKYLWDVFTALTEASVKQAAMATMDTLEPEGLWVDLSEVRDEVWARTLAELGFPGCPPREGMERWAGF